MLAKVSNDFSPPIRKDSCRLSSCVNVCLHCVIVNRHSVLSCRRSPTRPTIARIPAPGRDSHSISCSLAQCGGNA